MTGMAPEEVEKELRAHLRRKGLTELNESTWKIGYSQLSGRGVIAERDIRSDELVYADAPLVLGPRCYAKNTSMCVVCYKTDCVLFSCDRGCGLPVCSDTCQENPDHENGECQFLRELEPTCGSDWSFDLLRTVVPIRALKLPKEERDMFYRLEYHEADRHGVEVDILKKHIGKFLKPEEEEYMRRACRVMDTNSFETAVVQNDEPVSLRALYPIGGLTNHQCTPNTRHLVTDKGELLVYATMPIAKGEEITMSYTDVFWDTMTRRQFLQATKHFDCTCARCNDPTEFGSFLSALRCTKAQCAGFLLPDKPLKYDTSWICNKCDLIMNCKGISYIRSGLTSFAEDISAENPRKILKFIKQEMSLMVPTENYIMLDMMFLMISFFGHVKGLHWQEISDEELDTKIEYCYKLIDVLDILKCGDSKKKGLILYELYCANFEKFRRISSGENKQYTFTKDEISESENNSNLLEAIRLLKNDIVTSLDYRKIWQSRILSNNES